MDSFYYLREIGDVYIPALFLNVAADGITLKLFKQRELNQFSRIFECIRRGNIAVLSGVWDDILKLHNYTERKKEELIEPRRRREKRIDREKRQPAKDIQLGLSRLMCIAHNDGSLDVEPKSGTSATPLAIPYLLELVGEVAGANEGLPFLVPVKTILALQDTLEHLYPVSALSYSLVAPPNVFPPNSQETIELFQIGLEYVKTRLPVELGVLDMGCGSGCLALLASQVFADKRLKLLATDYLPEAVAATKINLHRCAQQGGGVPCEHTIDVTESGDLFEPIGDQRFDLIIFNAPWVVSPARNRAEIAFHDERQQTVKRFLLQTGEHLKNAGFVLLGYSNNSGEKAIENLEQIIREANLQIETIFKTRIRTRRAKRKWETIFVYVLMSPAT